MCMYVYKYIYISHWVFNKTFLILVLGIFNIFIQGLIDKIIL